MSHRDLQMFQAVPYLGPESRCSGSFCTNSFMSKNLKARVHCWGSYDFLVGDTQCFREKGHGDKHQLQRTSPEKQSTQHSHEEIC